MNLGAQCTEIVAIQASSLGAYITIQIGNRYATALVDTGAQRSFVKPEYAGETCEIRECEPLHVKMGNSVTTQVNKMVECEVRIQKMTCKHEFYILEGCIADCILEFDFQERHKCYARPDKLALVLQNNDEVPFLSKFCRGFLQAAAVQATPETHFSPEVRANEHKSVENAKIRED